MPVPYQSVLHATIDLARRADRAEIEFCALAGAHGDPSEARLEIGGGVALASRASSPLNKVLGLGLDGPVSDDELDRLEAWYRERSSPVQIELSPYAYADLPARLCARGYVVQGFESELGRAIGAVSGSSVPPLAAQGPMDVAVTLAPSGQDELWLRVTAAGFAAAEAHVGGSPAAEATEADVIVEMMRAFTHPAIRRYLAWVDDEPAGAVASWTAGGVLGIFGASTLPVYRRRGVQTALTIRTVEDAWHEADLAIATTAPGSTSQRTFERLGFRVLYTRTIFVKT